MRARQQCGTANESDHPAPQPLNAQRTAHNLCAARSVYHAWAHQVDALVTPYRLQAVHPRPSPRAATAWSVPTRRTRGRRGRPPRPAVVLRRRARPRSGRPSHSRPRPQQCERSRQVDAHDHGQYATVSEEGWILARPRPSRRASSHAGRRPSPPAVRTATAMGPIRRDSSDMATEAPEPDEVPRASFQARSSVRWPAYRLVSCGTPANASARDAGAA